MNRLTQLAINEEGFVFDPATGQSFSVNACGLVILKGFRNELDVPDIIAALESSFTDLPENPERDVMDFKAQLRNMRLL